jgi:hypothetical protein
VQMLKCAVPMDWMKESDSDYHNSHIDRNGTRCVRGALKDKVYCENICNP